MVRFRAEFEELLNRVEGIAESMLIIFFCLGPEDGDSKGITISSTKKPN